MITSNYKYFSFYNTGIPYIKDNLLYTKYNNTLYCTDMNMYITKRMPSDSTSDIKDRFDDVICKNNGEIQYKGEVVYTFDYKSASVSNQYMILSNDKTAILINLRDKTTSEVFSGEELIGSCIFKNKICVISKNGVFSRLIGSEKKMKKMNVTVEITDFRIIDNKLHILSTTDTCYVYDEEFKELETYSWKYWTLDGYSIGYDSNYNIHNILDNTLIPGNMEDILDIKETGDFYFYAMGNKIFYHKKDTRFGKMLECHSDTILSLSVNNRCLISTSKDETCNIYELGESFKLLRSIKTGVMNSSAIDDEMCVMGGDGGMACILRNLDNLLNSEEINESSEEVLNSKNHVFYRKISDKDINSITINKKRRIILVGLSDKTCRVFDYDLNILRIIQDHKKGVLSVYAGHKYFCTAGNDKTIKVYNYDYECVSVLSGHDTPVICTKIIDNMLVSSSIGGLIKIWDIKKGLCLENIDLKGDVWSIIINRTVISEDAESYVMNNEKGYDILMGIGNVVESFRYIRASKKTYNEVHIKNKEYEKVVTDNNKLIYFLIKSSNGEQRDRLLSKYKNKLYEIIIAHGRMKDVEVLDYLIDYILRNKLYDKKLIMNIRKYIYCLDELYVELVKCEKNEF